MIRTVSAIAATTLLFAACTGSDDDAISTTTARTPTTAAPVETTTTSTVPATTTTEPAPTTTAVDEDALIAQVEAAYFAAYDAYHRAIFDPSNEVVREELAGHYDGAALANTISILDDLVELGAVARENPDFGPARAQVTGAVRFTNGDLTEASLVVCELNAEWFVEPAVGPNGEDSVLRAEVIRSELVILLRLVDGTWKQVAGGGGSDQAGIETCD